MRAPLQGRALKTQFAVIVYPPGVAGSCISAGDLAIIFIERWEDNALEAIELLVLAQP